MYQGFDLFQMEFYGFKTDIIIYYQIKQLWNCKKKYYLVSYFMR